MAARRLVSDDAEVSTPKLGGKFLDGDLRLYQRMSSFWVRTKIENSKNHSHQSFSIDDVPEFMLVDL